MKNLLLIFILLYSLCISAQRPDTIIHTPGYTSYYCTALKEPICVIYTLKNGGGDCSRKKFRFHKDGKLNTATPKDYAKNGFDMGHLANAADFANDCVLEEKTFRFYNCLPQTPALNRGQWKHWETLIRQRSQRDSLLIIAGGIFGNHMIGKGVYVPDYCWKIVYLLPSHQLFKAILCNNDGEGQCHEIKYEFLMNLIGDMVQPPNPNEGEILFDNEKPGK